MRAHDSHCVLPWHLFASFKRTTLTQILAVFVIFQVAEEGQYYLKQLCVEIGQLHFIWPQFSSPKAAPGFGIVADPPKIIWKQEEKGKMMMMALILLMTMSMI